MFNRNNLPSNPFGARSDRPPPRDQYSSGPSPSSQRRPVPGGAPPAREDYDTSMRDPDTGRPSAGPPQYSGGQRKMPARPGGPPAGGQRGQSWQLRPAKSPDNTFTFRNLVAVSPMDIPSRGGTTIYLLLQGSYVVSALPFDGFPPGQISLSDAQRTWMGIALTDSVHVQEYDAFAGGAQAYLGSMDVEIGFASQKKQEPKPYDQDDLEKEVKRIFENQILAPGQRFMMDLRSVPLILVVKTVQMGDFSEKSSSTPVSSDPKHRGILTPYTAIAFYKDARTPIQLKASSKRPAANAIVAPDFKFEDMGIGGLDTEFGVIFRRAFASRIFPPGLIEKLGIQHVKGILLYGPPGTGKTLIARQIGKMLNAREPKIINGPEVLNKYVGQSEENIRKLFADAEKEYKEKGDESGLHIIIFDELDAVCKQRGSGAGGGTGVGDSVVNQLLSKLDGVDQLNNILLIGMTNRMDMIDDALLRPGRLEVHMEISLPDEFGRGQILKIHTQKMRDNQIMAQDVDLAELARLTKNFSGAEINGLVKSATSYAFNRHVKGGTMAGISDDVDQMQVNRGDFHNALGEVKPAFGVSEAELSKCLRLGIIMYSPFIQNIIEEGRLFVKQVRDPESTPLFSVLLHGDAGSGKTALAAQIATESEYPFIKLLSPEDMVGMNEMAKVQHITKVFMDAYKSPLSIVVIDSIEEMIEWVPIGPRFSNTVLQTIKVLLRKSPPANRNLLILATSNKRSVLQELDLFAKFSTDIPVPNLNSYQELQFVMSQSGVFSDEDIQRSLLEVQQMTRSQDIGVGIQRILEGIETAKMDTDPPSRFAGVISRAISERPFSERTTIEDPTEVAGTQRSYGGRAITEGEQEEYPYGQTGSSERRVERVGGGRAR